MPLLSAFLVKGVKHDTLAFHVPSALHRMFVDVLFPSLGGPVLYVDADTLFHRGAPFQLHAEASALFARNESHALAAVRSCYLPLGKKLNYNRCEAAGGWWQ